MNEPNQADYEIDEQGIMRPKERGWKIDDSLTISPEVYQEFKKGIAKADLEKFKAPYDPEAGDIDLNS